VTSYSSTSGPGYGSYSWVKGTASTSTGTTTYGPHKPAGVSTGSGTDGAGSKDKGDVDPDDLAILVLVPPNELEGYLIIWRLATESKGKQIIDAAAKLLV